MLPRHKATNWVSPGRSRKSTRPGANGVVELSVLTKHAEHIRGCRLIYDAEALFAARTIVMHSANGSPLSPAEADALIDEEIGLTAGADAVICVTPAEAAMFCDRQQAPVHCVSHPVTVRADVSGFDARRGYLFVGRLLEQDSPN